MSKAKFRLTCCLCRRLIPLKGDVYALDAEWQRRYPDMVGVLACSKCALSTSWQCRHDDDTYDPGHIPSTKTQPCWDHFDHVGRHGTQVAMVVMYPEAGALQGAAEYLRTRRPHPSDRKLHNYAAARRRTGGTTA